MTKRKLYVFAAALVVAGIGLMLFNRPPDTAENGSAVANTVAQTAGVAVAMPPSAQPAAAITNQTPTVRGTLPYVLTSVKPFQKSLRLAAEAMGAKSVCVLSRNAMLIEADAATRARLAADGRFEEPSEFLPSSKVQPELAAMIADGVKSVDVSLVALAAEDRQIVISCLEQGGGEMLKGCINEGSTIRAKLPAALVADLAMRGDVRWMERFEYPRIMNDVAVTNVAMNVQEVWNTYGLTGAGQNISTSDTGIDTGDLETMHADLTNAVQDIKVVEDCETSDKDGHGTHTSGSIVGDGTMSDGKIRGTAWGAKLYAWFCDGGDLGVLTPSTCAELFRGNVDGTEWPTFIHSASWGSNSGGKYTSECVNQDEYVWKNPEFLPVFSAGNAGSGNYTIGSPAAAKNVLTVGATQNLRTEPVQKIPGTDTVLGNGDPTVTAEYSSRGPCQDGRIKPDIAAPGTGVLSTRSYGVNYSYGIYDDYYAYDTGTSMSCPLTAGAVALVRQWLVEKKGFVDEDGKRPTAALMKAVITGGAKGVTNPNRNQGWGRVDLANTLFPADLTVQLIDRIPFAPGFVTNIVIETTNAAPLDVQLAWVDYPGSESGDQKLSRLVNDLDLTVEPWLPGDSCPVLYGNGGTAPDTKNNMESVRIASAVPTKYVITVSCKHIVHDYTEGGAAALYIRGAFDPEVRPELPIRIVERDVDFLTLEKALADVRVGETVEVCDRVFCRTPATVAASCTILATNEDASASLVTRAGDAGIRVPSGATLTVSNIAFAASSAVLVSVDAGGRFVLGARTDMGVPSTNVVIETAAADGFVLAAPLVTNIMLKCAEAKNPDEVFGTYTCSAEEAMGKIIANGYDAWDEIFGCTDDGRLFWKVQQVPVDEAAGYFADENGNIYAYARMDRVFERFFNAQGKGLLADAPNLVVRKSGTLTLPFEIASTAMISGENGAVITPTNAAAFSVSTGGALTISNLVFSGYVDKDMTDDRGFMCVGGGALTLACGAEFRNMTGYANYGSGIVDVKAGSMTMLPGSAIIGCSAMGGTSGTGYGGAICLAAENCTLELKGGRISNCHAATYGGGVFVDTNGSGLSDVSVSGPLVIADNGSGNYEKDNLFLRSDKMLPHLRLVDNLSAPAEVGIRYGIGSTGNSKNKPFMTNAAGTVDNATLQSLVNDANGSLEAATNAANDKLIWVAKVNDGQCSSLAAKVILIDSEGSTNYYESVELAFKYMRPGTTNVVEMWEGNRLEDSVDVPAGCDVTLRLADGLPVEWYALERNGDVGFVIPDGASLTLTNVCVSGDGDDLAYYLWRAVGDGYIRSKPFFDVQGGRLVMQAGATVCDVLGFSSRSANAITVSDGGEFIMQDGALIENCTNAFLDADYAASPGVGGGVLVDGWCGQDRKSVARLCGGTIRGCAATRGGAICVCNQAEVYVSGPMRVEQDALGGNDFVVEDSSKLYLADAATGVFNMANGVVTPQHDTNFIGRVTWEWPDVHALTNSAAKFVHSVSGDFGTAVTNRVDANDVLLVWCGAVRGGQLYTNIEGKVYAPVADVSAIVPAPPVFAPLSALPSTADEAAVKAALSASDLADPSVAEDIKTLADYNEFCEWAQKIGVDDVVNSKKAGSSYKFGTEELLTQEEAPTVEITEIERAADGLTVSVVVKDGDDPVAVASEKVAEMFEATSDIGDWGKSVDLTVTDLSQTTTDEVQFKVVPKDNPDRAFIRLKY